LHNVILNNNVNLFCFVMKNNLGRRLREKQEVRQRVLDAAGELLGQGGAEAVTLRRVAQRIEYSATTIYLYFPNKEALLQEVCAVDFAAFSRSLTAAQRLTDPLERLRRVARTYVDFGLQFPNHYRVMFMRPDAPARSTLSADAAPANAEARTSTPSEADATPYDFLHAAVFKAKAAGCLRPEYQDVPQCAQILWSGLHGLVALHLVRAQHPQVSWRPIQATADLMIDCLIRGCTHEASKTV
jgi:AcrR family transcriptional regulator